MSFTHKKAALEDIKEKINQEVERKKIQFKLQENFINIEKQILSLSNQTDIFKNDEENNEDSKKNEMMK